MYNKASHKDRQIGEISHETKESIKISAKIKITKETRKKTKRD